MSTTALGSSGVYAERRPVRAPAWRLAWISVILGLISLDVDALAFLSPMAPSRWYADLLLQYGPATVVTVAMLAVGGPLALIGLFCASATVRRQRASFATLLGVAICTFSLAVPLCYAVFVLTFLRGLL